MATLVPFSGKIKDGEIVKIECVDWTGGQIKNNDSADGPLSPISGNEPNRMLMRK